MIRVRAAAALLPFLFAACASPLGTRVPETGFAQTTGGVVQVSEPAPVPSEVKAASSFEDEYRDRCNKRGATGVAAESMTSVLESMAALCGASGIEPTGEEQAPDLKDPDEVRARIQF